MKNFNDTDATPLWIPLWIAYTIIIIFVITAVSFLEMGREAGYREGQMDALKGKQMFLMQIQPDTLYIQKPQ